MYDNKIDLTGVTNIKKHLDKQDFSDVISKYHDYGTQYACDVLFSDRYITCRDTQLACFRHLRDLKRQNSDGFPYQYDPNYVNAIEYFAREIPNPTNLSEKIILLPWESFILDSLIGWRNTLTGGCRFHIVDISVGRKQGKTWLASILTNFYYFVVGISGSAQDFLVASKDSEHVNKLFDYVALQAKQIIQLDDFKEAAKKKAIEVQATQIIAHETRSIVRKGSAQGGGFDSKHDLFAVFDEIGDLKPKFDEKVNQILTGQGDIINRMFVKISTAYPDPKVSFKREQDSMREVIEQDYLRVSDETFMVIYSQDSENEVFEPEKWEKSNPLLGIKDTYDKKLNGLISLRDNMERAGHLASFANKTLNLWSRQFQDSYLSLANINKNVIKEFDITGRDVYLGVDASMTNDNFSIGQIYPYDGHMFHIEQHSFIPFAQAKTIEAKEKQDGLNYRELAEQGFCEVTDNKSGTIDFDQVWHWLNDFIDKNRLSLKAIVVDPKYLKWFAQRVESYKPDWPYIPIRQTSFELNEPTKNLQKAFIDENVSILDDPLLIDGLNNAVVKQDKGGMVKIDRVNRTSDHIDTADAIINAFDQAQNHFEDFKEADENPINSMNSEQKKDYFAHMFG